MIGILLQILVSWLLLHFLAGKNLNALGLSPTKGRGLSFLAGFVLAAGICSLYHLLTTAVAGNGWTINPKARAAALLPAAWWVLRSVLFEELIFRGALLYLAFQKMGAVRATLLSAACFGLYHWFSYSAWGNPMAMILIFLMTGLAGLMFAWAFVTTGSIYLPIALHFGWNLVQLVVFSNGPLGDQLLVRIHGAEAEGLSSLLVFLFQVFALPSCFFLGMRFFRQGQKSVKTARNKEREEASSKIYLH